MEIGAQLYTVRDFCQTENDFITSCEKIKRMGFGYVQLSGIGDFSALTVKKILDGYGLKAVCTHRPPEKYIENIENEIEFHKALGCEICGIGAMPGFNIRPENITDFALKFRPVSERLRAEGLTFAYHNHSFEFEKVKGKFGFDLLEEAMDGAGMKYIIDVYWIAVAGINPAEFIRNHKGRIACVHLKDLKVISNAPFFAAVGEGNLDWSGIISACREAEVPYGLVEQDDCGDGDPFECLEKSLEYLSKRYIG